MNICFQYQVIISNLKFSVSVTLNGPVKPFKIDHTYTQLFFIQVVVTNKNFHLLLNLNSFPKYF